MRYRSVPLSEIVRNNLRLDAGFYLAPEPIDCSGTPVGEDCQDDSTNPCRACYEREESESK